MKIPAVLQGQILLCADCLHQLILSLSFLLSVHTCRTLLPFFFSFLFIIFLTSSDSSVSRIYHGIYTTQSKSGGKASEAQRVLNAPSAEKVSNRAYTSSDCSTDAKGKQQVLWYFSISKKKIPLICQDFNFFIQGSIPAFAFFAFFGCLRL